MSHLEFESLVVRYVDGSATPDEVAALRSFVSSSAGNREFFRARVRLRRAQRGFATRDAAEALLRGRELPGIPEFDQLTYAYLDGQATRSQVCRLRDAIRSSEDFRIRFQARMRLHGAQTAYLRSRQRAGIALALRSLGAFAQRFGRASAHLCLLLLVFVELRVTVPAEYSGLMFSVQSAVAESVEPEFPLSVSPDEPELPLSTGAYQEVLPPMPMPAPVQESGLDELLESGSNAA